MNVSLTPEFEAFVNEKLKRGSYSSASEVVRAGLRLLQERDAELAARLESLRKDVRLGGAQLKRGEGARGREVFKRLRKRGQARSDE
jgi:antitoxin ParD1/3/4